jgi:very-short-patch-repair endonuclease
MLEAEIDRRCREAGLPILVRQFKLPWRGIVEARSDLAAPWAHLLIEADSRRWHTRKRDMAVDRRRDRDATEHGWRTSRWVHEEIFGDAAELVRSIRASLEAAA